MGGFRRGARGGGGKAEEEVDVAAAEGGALGVGAGDGDGFQVVAGPGAEEGFEPAAEAVRRGIVIGGAVAVDHGVEVEVFGSHETGSRARA